MKRVLLFVVFASVLAFSLCLCACGSSSSSASSASSSASAQASESSASASSESASSESASASAASSESASASATSAASGATSSASAAPSSAAADTSASPSAAAATSSAAASAGETAANGEHFDFEDKCTDEHGNITLYALTELKGWMVATLLDQQEYEWNESECMWLRPMDGASFAAIKETGPYTIDTYNQMNEKGGAIAAIGLSVVAGYKDPQAALKGNAQCVVEDSYFNGTDGIAIFYGPTMKEYLAIISKYSESTALFMIFSKEAVASGMADEYLGAPTGGSFQEIWKSVTGEDSYGH